jgi:hypothetical protein
VSLGFPFDFSLPLPSILVHKKLKLGSIYVDALCNLGLEISERPLKRPLLDFENLSISDSSGKGTFFSHLPLAFRFLGLDFCLG